MKHYEINFTDGTVETVMSDELPPDQGWWKVTHLHLDAETESKFMPHGRVWINIRNVTFITEG